MTLLDVVTDKRKPEEIPTVELNEMMKVIRAAKFWREPYYTLDREQQRRAVRRWVHDDVWGNTFPPLEGPLS